MITGTDQLTKIERRGVRDCLIELVTGWLMHPLPDAEAARLASLDEVCLVIANMRHLDARFMEIERRRWIERVARRLCAQEKSLGQYLGAVQIELERKMKMEMLRFHNWREEHAPKLSDRVPGDTV